MPEQAKTPHLTEEQEAVYRTLTELLDNPRLEPEIRREKIRKVYSDTIATSALLHKLPFTPEERASGLFDEGIDVLIKAAQAQFLLYPHRIQLRENALTEQQRVEIIQNIAERKDAGDAFDIIDSHLSVLTPSERILMIRTVVEAGQGGLFFTPLFKGMRLLTAEEKAMVDFARPNDGSNSLQ